MVFSAALLWADREPHLPFPSLPEIHCSSHLLSCLVPSIPEATARGHPYLDLSSSFSILSPGQSVQECPHLPSIRCSYHSPLKPFHITIASRARPKFHFPACPGLPDWVRHCLSQSHSSSHAKSLGFPPHTPPFHAEETLCTLLPLCEDQSPRPSLVLSSVGKPACIPIIYFHTRPLSSELQTVAFLRQPFSIPEYT